MIERGKETIWRILHSSSNEGASNVSVGKKRKRHKMIEGKRDV